MKLRYIYSISVLCSAFSLYGQNADTLVDENSKMVGINLMHIVPLQFKTNEKLFNIEPNVKVSISHGKYYWNNALGYTLFEKNPIYNNLLYTLQGMYVKSAIETAGKGIFSNGVAACISIISEKGTFFFEGNYFDNYYVPFPNRTSVVFFAEPYFMIHITLLELLRFEAIAYADIFVKQEYKQVPIYYIPGSGYQNSTDYLNLNVTMKLFIKL